MKFTPDKLKRVARVMSGDRGVEKTPAEWEAVFTRMVADYRAAAREAGRDDVAGWSDRAVWNRIVHLAGGA